jgi:adenylosuccinate synthase
VARFSGGHQAGHTVQLGDFRHTFSNFCSGSLRGVPGYFGPATVVFPPAILVEWQEIGRYRPTLLIHPLASVCVPQDIAWNRALERLHGHGSCGVGYGTAVERGRAGILLSAKDLDCGWIFAQKLKGIGLYYEELISRRNTGLLAEFYRKEIEGQTDEAFMAACVQARPLYGLAGLRGLGSKYDQLILEGSQGILLDAEEGAYPHLSWGSVTSQAAMAFLLELLPADLEGIDVTYVTRCYQTRHGAGPMSSSQPVTLLHPETEANVNGPWQGPFRTATLDSALLAHSLRSDRARMEAGLSEIETRLGRAIAVRRRLVITCLDQLPGFDALALAEALERDTDLRFDSVLGGSSPDSSTMRLLR